MESNVNAPIEKIERVAPRNNARGVWIVMADGREWLVPFMPVGPRAVPLLKMLTELDNLNNRLDRVVEDVKDAPNEQQMDEITRRADPGLMTMKNFDFGHEVMMVNYPQLSKEDCASIFDVVSFPELISVFTGSRRS